MQAGQRLAALLQPLSNYERDRPNEPGMSLQKMQSLLTWEGCAVPDIPLVQVGGSKGKGSTVLYLEALAQAAGLRTGSYLSPHLHQVTERLRVEGRSIGAEELVAALEPLLAHDREAGLELSFFEALTGAAIRVFASRRVELGLLEVGLGGRLDATTAVPVAASILTLVELEHTEILGDSVGEIAAEKAWIIRPGRPAYTAAKGEALKVIEEHARQVGARLFVLGRDFHIQDLEEQESATESRAVLSLTDGSRHPFELLGASRFELVSLALAAACLHDIVPEARLQLLPVPRPELPGRFELRRCADGLPLVLDGAHTEASLGACADELERRFPGQSMVVLFASVVGKQWKRGLSQLLRLADRIDRVCVTELAEMQTEDPESVAAWLSGQGVRAEVVADAATGLRAILSYNGVRLVVGSFYLVGAVRRLLEVEAEAEVEVEDQET